MNKVLLRQYAVVAVVTGALLLLVVTGLLLSSDRQRVGRADQVSKDFRQLGADVNPSEIWMQRAGTELTQLQQDNEKLEAMLLRLEKRLDLAEQERRQILEAPPPLAAPTSLPEPVVLPPAAALPTPFLEYGQQVQAPPNAVAENDAVLAIAVYQAPEGPKAAPKLPKVASYLPAGSFVGAALLTGLDAPTGGGGRSNPVPVLLALLDEGTLPNRWRHQVQECMVTAAGYGDLAAERAYIRLDRFSCVLADGGTVDLAVSGYVVGEDGKAGLRGRVVSKQGALIARSLLAGMAGGIGEGLSQSVTSVGTSALGTVQSVNANRLLEYGLARGAGKALDQVARWYLERANEVYPVIEVNSGRKVELVLIEGLRLGVDLLRLAKDQKEDAFR